MDFAKYQDVPFASKPKEQRVRRDDMAACQGGCCQYTQIINTEYQLCSSCSFVGDTTVILVMFHPVKQKPTERKGFARKTTKCYAVNVMPVGRISIGAFGTSFVKNDFCGNFDQRLFKGP